MTQTGDGSLLRGVWHLWQFLPCTLWWLLCPPVCVYICIYIYICVCVCVYILCVYILYECACMYTYICACMIIPDTDTDKDRRHRHWHRHYFIFQYGHDCQFLYVWYAFQRFLHPPNWYHNQNTFNKNLHFGILFDNWCGIVHSCIQLHHISKFVAFHSKIE